jgi:hypothetical protein
MSAEQLDVGSEVHPATRVGSAILRDGPVAGLIGSMVIAGFFAVWSMSLGRSPLHVAALLGQTLFYGGSDAAATAMPIVAYSAAHMLTLIAAGMLMAAVARFSPAVLRVWFIAVVALLLCVAHALVLPLWYGDVVRATLPVWLVASATGLGLLAMSEYLWKRNVVAVPLRVRG